MRQSLDPVTYKITHKAHLDEQQTLIQPDTKPKAERSAYHVEEGDVPPGSDLGYFGRRVLGDSLYGTNHIDHGDSYLPPNLFDDPT